MDINHMTEKVQEASGATQSLALDYHNSQIEVEHLLLTLLKQDEGLASSLVTKAGADRAELLLKVRQEVENLPKISISGGGSEQLYLSNRLNRLLNRAEQQMKKLHDEYLSVEHLVLAMTEDDGVTGRFFKAEGLTEAKLIKALQNIRGHQRVTSTNPEATY